MNQIETTPRHRVFESGAIRYDEALRELHVGGRRRSLEAKPLAVLHALLVHAGAIVTKRELMQAAWGNADHIAETSLTTAISKLRAVLGDQGKGLIAVGARRRLPDRRGGGCDHGAGPAEAAFFAGAAGAGAGPRALAAGAVAE